MDPQAIYVAVSRIRVAERAVASLADSDGDDFRDHWFVFLTAFKSVYTALQEGAKGQPKSLQWMGARNRERRNNPLLQYLYIARNDEEHGLNLSVMDGIGGISVDTDGTTAEDPLIVWLNPETGLVEAYRKSGQPVTVLRQHGPGPLLRPVRDRDGTVIQPPPDPDNRELLCFPLAAAEAGMLHIKALVEAAGRIPT